MNDPTPQPNDFGLRAALGEDDYVRLIRRQLATARQYNEQGAIARLAGWLRDNGHEETP
jgi:hypothetical protein